MAKKDKGQLLTLIYGDRVHMAPGSKVIKEALYSKLIDAKDLLNQIKTESNQYRLGVAKECESIKEEAEQAGFKQGFEKWLEKIKELEERIDQVKAELEEQIIPIALTSAKKIVGKEMEGNREAIVDIVRSHLKAVKQNKRVTVWVSKADFSPLDKNKHLLKDNFEELEVFSVRPRDDLTRGSCIIETESGIINATIENQWALIEKVFEKSQKEKV